MAGNSVRPKLDAVEVADDPGGEVRFYIREREPGVFVLSRAERGGGRMVIMWSTDPMDLERYLTKEMGDQARQWKGMGRLDFPVSVEQITNHFTIETLGTNVVALRPELDVAVMRQSYLDPEGKPLFRLWTEPYRPGSTPRTFPA